MGAALLGSALAACSEPVPLGSELLWTARHEEGDLSEWEAEGRGGVVSEMVVVTDADARSGRHALRLDNAGDQSEGGACVGREFPGEQEAYYSAWYSLPAAPRTISAWTLLRIRVVTEEGREPADDSGAAGASGMDGAGGNGGAGGASAGDPRTWSSVFGLSTRSLPDDRLVLELFFHDREYLRSPVAVPTPFVPTERWFHLEVLYRGGEDGGVVVWLDGVRTYAVRGRNLGNSSGVQLQVCNVGQLASAAEVYVDDVAVSRVRVTPRGVLTR